MKVNTWGHVKCK